MGKLIDLTDRTFDMLTVIKRVEDRKPGRPMWLCQCECGNTVVVSSTNLLRTNGTKSCGCLRHTTLFVSAGNIVKHGSFLFAPLYVCSLS